jgi:hypothetical protein
VFVVLIILQILPIRYFIVTLLVRATPAPVSLASSLRGIDFGQVRLGGLSRNSVLVAPSPEAVWYGDDD